MLMNKNYILEKGWKCQNGLFPINPKGTYDCENCENCNAKKGIIVEDANSCIFIGEEDIKKTLS